MSLCNRSLFFRVPLAISLCLPSFVSLYFCPFFSRDFFHSTYGNWFNLMSLDVNFCCRSLEHCIHFNQFSRVSIRLFFFAHTVTQTYNADCRFRCGKFDNENIYNYRLNGFCLFFLLNFLLTKLMKWFELLYQ